MPGETPSSGSPLSTQTVAKVARLARLELTDAQAELYRGQLGAILGYVERLGKLDLEGVEPMATPLDSSGPLAEDLPGPTLPPEALKAMAPEMCEGFVRVPKVLGEGSA